MPEEALNISHRIQIHSTLFAHYREEVKHHKEKIKYLLSLFLGA